MSALMISESSVGVLSFGIAILLLDALDISLPRGDSVGVAGSLVAAMMLAVGPWWALATGVVSAIIVQGSRAASPDHEHSIGEVWVRLVASAIAVGVSLVLEQTNAVPPLMATVVVPIVFLLTEVCARQAALAMTSGRSLWRLIEGNLIRRASLFAAQVSIAALTTILHETMGAWALVPVMALLILIRQSYAMLLEIRETYHTTIAVLIDAAESPEPGRAGHSERVAEIAREIGGKCGLRAEELERLSYAALLHDVDGIAGTNAALSSNGRASSIVSEVRFLADVVPVLQVIDGLPSANYSERDILCGLIVALASDVDSAARPQVHLAHIAPHVSRVVPLAPPRVKARVVSAALELGYSLPAID